MTIESPEERDMAVAEIVRKALEIDPSFSAEAYRELSAESAEKPQLLEEGARRLLARSEAEALAWADLLGTDVDAAKGVIAEVLAESDPLHAVKVLVDSGISLEDPNGSAVMVIQHWGASAPEAAATWAVSVNAGESRKAAIKAIAPQWMMADSKAATDWMATLDDSNVRQEVSHAMAEALVGNPEFINQSILQYADPKIRADLEQQVRQLRLDTESEPEAEAEPER